jgi:hypothetical protein
MNDTREKYPVKRLSAATFLLVTIIMMLQSLAHTAAPPQCTAKDTAISRFELVEILQRDSFSLPLYPQDEFNRLGEISVGKSCFVIFLFTTEFRSAPGTNPHFAARLLVLRDWKYLGMYQLDNENMPTRIRGNRVEFPGMTKDRNFVPFSEAGPPQEVWLNGETRTFRK